MKHTPPPSTPSAPLATLMVVDDTPANLTLLDTLLRQNGYEVRLFPRGALALKSAQATPPDLILLDIMMPDMNGFEMCRHLKANPALADIPVIFISALTDNDNKVRAFAEGGMDYVTKPFEEVEVLARIRTHLSLHAMAQTQLAQKAQLAALVAERTADLERAQRMARIGSWKLDCRAQTLHWSAETYRLFGIEQGRTLGLSDFFERIHPEDRPRVTHAWEAALKGKPYDIEHRLLQPAGAQWVRERAEFSHDTDGTLIHAFGTVQDISEHKDHLAYVNFIQHHDLLTGLPNRTRFIDLLRMCMAQTQTQTRGHFLAIAYIDLDDFARFNTQIGHEKGDTILKIIAQRLAKTTPEPHCLARIGGDEFALIMVGLAHPRDYQTQVERIQETTRQPIAHNGDTLTLSASIGVSLYPQSEPIEAEQLLRQADQAMYLAKLAGKNRHHLFDPLQDGSTRERFMRIEEIREGLVLGQMRLFYQPKIRLSTGKLVGFEALIRWQHPERGLVPPAHFIPLLAQHPLSITLGDWVIEAALAQLALWNQKGLHTTVSVNVDSLQLHDKAFASRLRTQLAAQPEVAPSQLELEILETGAINNIEQASALLAHLNEIGVRCSLDDFGTGYSSLTFLKQLPAETIKIDQSFIRSMLDDSENASIVHSILGLAHSFDRHTLAEGVETLEHGEVLIQLGCEMAQGYGIARPMPADAVEGWVSSWKPPPLWLHTQALESGDIPLLLMDIAHRQWIKTLCAHLENPHIAPPPLHSQTCRLGQWLARPSTVKRYRHAPAEFAHLVTQHEHVHAHAKRLIYKIKNALKNKDSPQYMLTSNPDWQALEADSQTLLNSLKALRNRQSQSGE